MSKPVPGICRLLDSQKRSAVSYDSSKFERRSWKIGYMDCSFFFLWWMMCVWLQLGETTECLELEIFARRSSHSYIYAYSGHSTLFTQSSFYLKSWFLRDMIYNVKVKVNTNQSVASVESFWAEVAGERHLNLHLLALILYIYYPHLPLHCVWGCALSDDASYGIVWDLK